MGKIFYGWWVLLSMFLITTATSISVSTLPIFYTSLKADFGWTHQQVTSPSSLMYFVAAFSAPVVGWLLDRTRPKRLVIGGVFGTILGLFLYTRVQSLWQLQAVYFLLSISLATSSIIPGMYMLTHWFDRYRGVAVGLFLVGSSFGGIIFPQISKVLLENYPWREAALYLTIVASFFLVPSLLILRNKPADLGLFPDGLHPDTRYGEESQSKILKVSHLNLGQALKQRSFHLIFWATAFLYFGLTGVFQNLSLYLEDLSVSQSLTANLISLYFTFSILGKISFGTLSDYFPKKNIFLLSILSMALGLMLLRLSAYRVDIFLFPFAIGYGFGYSGVYAMVQLIVAEYYQGKSYGSILGIITTADMLSGGLGITLLSSIRGSEGSYLPAFDLCILLCVLAFIFVFLLPRKKFIQYP